VNNNFIYQRIGIGSLRTGNDFQRSGAHFLDFATNDAAQNRTFVREIPVQ